MKSLSINQQVNQIEKVYLQATEKEIKDGRNWYNDAYKFAVNTANKYGLTTKQICQLISLLSPQKKWAQNKIDVIRIIEEVDTESIFSCQRTLEECRQVINSNWTIPTNRTKTYKFALCIEFAGRIDIAVIDRHAIKIAFGQYSAKPIGITPKRYSEAEEAYKILSDKYEMYAAQMQAITWVTYKRIVNR